MTVDLDLLRALPKVSLHDHLDGGLRPQTILELAAEVGHELPADNADDLGRWFRESADSGSLVRYLETFDHTIAVMQTADHLRRVAAEFVEDLAADGVVYGEARWAPEQHTQRGLTKAQAVEAVRDGLRPRAWPTLPATGSADRRPAAAHLDAARRPDDRDRRAGPGLPRRRRGRLRHRRRRGRLPARALPAGVRPAQAAQRPLHDPRRRGRRRRSRSGRGAALLGQPDRPRRPDHRRHHFADDGRRPRSAGWRRTSATSRSRWSCARRPTCRPAPPPRSPSTPSPGSTSSASG